ncbi:MAG: hypothetical protein ABDH49_06975 [Candidatus Hydrothermales bacterium]
MALFSKFFLLSSILFFSTILQKNKCYIDFESKRFFYYKKAVETIFQPESVYFYLKKFLEISDFKDSIKVLPLFLLAGIELKKEKLLNYKNYFPFLEKEVIDLLTIFENIDSIFFEKKNLKDTFLYFAYILNALNFKKDLELDISGAQTEVLFSYSLLKFYSGKIIESEKLFKKILENKSIYQSALYDDVLYFLSLIERLKENEKMELFYLEKLRDECPLTPYKEEMYLRFLTIHFERGEYSKVLNLKKEVSPFIDRLIPYFYAAYVFEGNIDSAETLILRERDIQKRDSIRYFTENKLIKKRKYETAEKLLKKFENTENDSFFNLKTKIYFLMENKEKLNEIFLKEKNLKRKSLVSKNLGKLLLKRGNLKESKKYFEFAHENTKSDEDLYYSLLVKLKLGEVKEENFYLDFLNKAKDTLYIKKVRLDYHFYLKGRGKFKECEENLVNLIKLTSENEEKKFYLKELFEVERYVKNDSLFLEILKENTKGPLSTFSALLAFDYMIERNFDDDKILSYLKDFEIKNNETGRVFFLKLGEFYLKRGKTKEASIFFKDLISVYDSISYKAIIKLGEIAILERNIFLLDTLIDYLVRAQVNKNPYIYYFLAQREEFKGNDAKAILLYEKAAENFKENRNLAAKMLLKAAILSPKEKKDLYFKRAFILAEDEKLKREIEEYWKKEMF